MDGERLVGIVTDRDIRVALNSPYVLHERLDDEIMLNNVTAEACMTPDPLTIAPDHSVLAAAQRLHDYKFGALPVIEGSHLVGITTVSDILTHTIELIQMAAPDAATE
jgi:acetoin utilization protein AcuB